MSARGTAGLTFAGVGNGCHTTPGLRHSTGLTNLTAGIAAAALLNAVLEPVVWLIGVVVCLLAAPQVQLFTGVGNG